MHKKSYFFIFLSILLFASCSKMSEEGLFNNSNTDQPSSISIIHSAPNTPNLAIAINGQSLNLSQFSYRTRTSYIKVYPGIYNFIAYPFNGSINTPYLNTSFNLKYNTQYSLFLINSLFKLEPLLVEDKLTMPANGKIKVRFANLSPDMNAIDFYVSSQDDAVAKNLKYKQISDFIELSIDEPVEFNIKNTGDNSWLIPANIDSKILTSPLLKKEKDKNFYTICLSGFKSSQTIEGGLIIENIVHQ